MTADEPSPARQHHAAADAADDRAAIRCAVLTISDTRTLADDRSGDAIVELLRQAGYAAAARDLVRDDPTAIEGAMDGWLKDANIHVIISTGGTGIARRDNTIEMVRRMLTAELDGFGELFRMLSYEQIGSSAMLSRSVAGLAAQEGSDGGDTFIFALPGSTNAVRLAMEKLIVPELPHLVWQRR